MFRQHLPPPVFWRNLEGKAPKFSFVLVQKWVVVVTLSTRTCGAGGEALGNWAANDEPGDNGAVMLSEIFFFVVLGKVDRSGNVALHN